MIKRNWQNIYGIISQVIKNMTINDWKINHCKKQKKKISNDLVLGMNYVGLEVAGSIVVPFSVLLRFPCICIKFNSTSTHNIQFSENKSLSDIHM